MGCYERVGRTVTLVLDMQIVKGLVASYGKTVASIHNISNSGLAQILKEIAEELNKD